jgi:hypothetical protein
MTDRRESQLPVGVVEEELEGKKEISHMCEFGGFKDLRKARSIIEKTCSKCKAHEYRGHLSRKS